MSLAPATDGATGRCYQCRYWFPPEINFARAANVRDLGACIHPMGRDTCLNAGGHRVRVVVFMRPTDRCPYFTAAPGGAL